MVREIEKFPYGNRSGLSESQAKENFIDFYKQYGPLTLKICVFVFLLTSTSALAVDTPAPAPNQCPAGGPVSPAPAPNNILPATKELIGIAAVGLVCAAAATNPVTSMGIAACLLTIAAKACNKL